MEVSGGRGSGSSGVGRDYLEENVNEVAFAFLEGHADVEAPRSLGGYSHDGELATNGARRGDSVEEDARNLPRLVLFLMLLGIIPSAVIFLVDVAVHGVFGLRERAATGGGNRGFAVYVVGGLGLCLMGTAVCRLWSREAEGSGIPQMKAIMSGFYDRMKPALSLWALLAKSVGLICVIGGGLPVGWEGPNVHISCIVAHHLGRLPGFRALRRDRALRMQFMVCACSVGLASSFGTPIGGVLYALETTAAFYLVPTFWKSLLATIAGSLVYDILYKTPLVEAFENTNFVAGDYTRSELMAFALMGGLMGLMGAWFVKCVHWVYNARRRRLPGTSRYLLVGSVAVLAAVVQYPLRLFRLDPRSAINEFFSASNLETLTAVDMILLLLIKFPLIVISIGLPVPAGVFIPCFLLGSGFGRLYGELLRLIFGSAIVPGGYAVVGAAAFTAGVTRALSCAVVIFEVTGQLKHMVPTLVAVLLSVIVGNFFNRSLYDTLIIMKKLPYMAHMRRDRDPTQKVGEIMRRNVVWLESRAPYGTIRKVLDKYPFESFPVVKNGRNILLLGSVKRRTLLELLSNSDNDGRVSEVAFDIDDHDAREGGELGGRVTESADEAGETGEDRINDGTRRNGKDAAEKVMESGILNIVAPGGGLDGDITQSHKEGTEMVRLVNGTRLDRDEGDRNIESDESTEGRSMLRPDLSPMVVTSNTSLGQLHFMFVMLMPTHALVSEDGRLAGIVTRSDIVQSGEIDAG